MRHLDLFSGIGGFAYAVDQIWPNAQHIFCDTDKFCQQVLKQHWPESYIYGDIRTIGSIQAVDLVTGGFPCQPFSAAGKRQGTEDDRYLWPEMLRVVQLTKPEWVIAENVRGIVTWNDGLVFETVCADLEAAGYEVQPFIIPAVGVDAPHRRDRVWFVAHAIDSGRRQPQRTGNGAPESLPQEHRPEDRTAWQPERTANHRHTSDNAIKPRLERYADADQRTQGRQEPERSAAATAWSEDWPEVAARLCSVGDGLSAAVDDFTLSQSQHRIQQIKAYGNAIVPQVAMEIMKGMI